MGASSRGSNVAADRLTITCSRAASITRRISVRDNMHGSLTNGSPRLDAQAKTMGRIRRVKHRARREPVNAAVSDLGLKAARHKPPMRRHPDHCVKIARAIPLDPVGATGCICLADSMPIERNEDG